jgi:hypothetical protein
MALASWAPSPHGLSRPHLLTQPSYTPIPTATRQRHTWVEEGLYLDEHTRGLDAQLVTYNGELRVFGAARVSFDFQEAGSITASYRCAGGLHGLACVRVCLVD